MINNFRFRLKFIVLVSVLLTLAFSAEIFSEDVTDVSPVPERGTSFLQTITVGWASTANPSNDTKVIFDDTRIQWRRNRETNNISTSWHKGRITVPPEVPAGTYRFRIWNGGFNFTGDWLSDYLTIDDFTVVVSKAFPDQISPGQNNVEVVFTLGESISGWASYSIMDITSTNPGVTVVSGRFLSSTQIAVIMNVSKFIEEGGLGLYIRYGIPEKLSRRTRVHDGMDMIGVMISPTHGGDFATVYLDSAEAVLVVGHAGPRITSVDPQAVARRDRRRRLQVAGSDFEQGIELWTQHSGVTFSNTMYLSPESLITYVTVTSEAPLGSVLIMTKNPSDADPTENNGVFSIVQVRPQYISVAPDVLIIGEANQEACITGANFLPQTYVVFETEDVTVLSNGYRSSTELCPSLSVNGEAYSRPVSFSIFNPGGVYTKAEDAIMLSKIPKGEKTIILLYPGRQGGATLVSESEGPSPVETVYTPFPIFRWFSRAQKYKISIYRPMPGQITYGEVINNYPVHESDVYGENYFEYPLYAIELEPGIRYFWKVQAYFNTPIEGDPSSPLGDVLESEVWSFVFDDSSFVKGKKEDTRFGTLNPVVALLLDPSYLEITAGDRATLTVRGLDKNSNYAAFIPDYSRLDYQNVEDNYPDIKLLPKSFGRVELVVPSIFNNQEFHNRLISNPVEFARFPVLLYISRNAKGVGALLATWKKKQYYALINVLPPKEAMLMEGELDKFNLGIATRQSETFEIVMDKPFKAGSVINGKGKVFIDSAGFREKGYLSVEVTEVVLDITGRALSGEVKFTGNENITLSGYSLTLSEILIKPNAPSTVKGTISIPASPKEETVNFTGVLSGLGELRGTVKLENDINLTKAKLPKESTIELDFSSYWSPAYKKYDPTFRGLIVSVSDENGKRRRIAAASPERLSSLSPVVEKSKQSKSGEMLDLEKIKTVMTSNESNIYLRAIRNTDGKIILSWLNKEKKAQKFNVYRRSPDESQYRLIAERIGHSKFLDIFTDSKESYWYKIAGVSNKDLEIQTSNPIKIDKITK